MSYKIWTLIVEKGDIVKDGAVRPVLSPEVEDEMRRSDMALLISGNDIRLIKRPKERVDTSAVATQRFAELETDRPKPVAPIVEAKPKPVEVKPKVEIAKDVNPEANWKRYEYVGGTSKKFWEIRLEGSKYVTRWGRIGTDGSVTVKECGHPHKAKLEYYKIIDAKLYKGYKQVK